MGKKFLLALVGIPSSGKTTFARALAEKFELNGYPTIVIGSDDIRNMIPGYTDHFEPDREPIIRKITLDLIKNCLISGFNVINDDLNYYKSMRHNLLDIANTQNSYFTTIFIKVPLKKAIEWNKKRGSPIPSSVIKNVFNKLDEPGDYSWDITLVTVNSIDIENEEIINLVYSKILSEILKPVKKEVVVVKSTPGKAESLDKLTRHLISELISSQMHKKFSRELSSARKKFLTKANKENYSLEEAREKFSKIITNFLKNHQSEE